MTRNLVVAACLGLVVCGCVQSTPEADSAAKSALLGRWRIVQGADGMVEFMENGQAVWAGDGQQFFGGYRVLSPTRMILYEDGDSILVDYEVQRDTLYYSLFGDEEEFAAIRVGR